MPDSAHEVDVKPKGYDKVLEASKKADEIISSVMGIETEGSPYKFTSTVDGGWRITIDYPQSQTDACLKISKKMGRNLKIIYVDPFEGFEGDE